MHEFPGYDVRYEALTQPRGKWAIEVEVRRLEDGAIVLAKCNPFPDHPFDTKLEALDQVKSYLRKRLSANEANVTAKRRA